ncbi:MAG: hypothetical protein AB9888_01345 [Bacteroidales bacterium]
MTYLCKRSEEMKPQEKDKTKEELLATEEKELNSHQRVLRSLLKQYPELTLEEAIEFANSLP